MADTVNTFMDELRVSPVLFRYFFIKMAIAVAIFAFSFVGIFSLINIVNLSAEFRQEGISVFLSYLIAFIQIGARQLVLFFPLIGALGVSAMMYQLIVRSEVIASQSLGMGVKHFMVLASAISLCCIVVSAILSELLIPWSYRVLETASLQTQGYSTSSDRQFYWVKQPYGAVGFYHHGNANEISKIRMAVFDHTAIQEIMIAKGARYDAANKQWIVSDITVYRSGQTSLTTIPRQVFSEDGFVSSDFIKLITTPPYGLSVASLAQVSYQHTKNDLYPYDQFSELLSRFFRAASIVLFSYIAMLYMLERRNARNKRDGALLSIGKIFVVLLVLLILQYVSRENVNLLSVYCATQVLLISVQLLVVRNWYNKIK